MEEQVMAKKKTNLEPQNTKGRLDREYPSSMAARPNAYMPQGSPTNPKRVAEAGLIPAESPPSPSQLTPSTTVKGGYNFGGPEGTTGTHYTPTVTEIGPFRKTKIVKLGDPDKLGGSSSAAGS
jgi:hypothetical protein